MPFKYETYSMFHNINPSSKTSLELIELILAGGTINDLYKYAKGHSPAKTASLVQSFYKFRKKINKQLQQEYMNQQGQ